jgi:hypothetical protein
MPSVKFWSAEAGPFQLSKVWLKAGRGKLWIAQSVSASNELFKVGTASA